MISKPLNVGRTVDLRQDDSIRRATDDGCKVDQGRVIQRIDADP